jgi:hypothetical protein
VREAKFLTTFVALMLLKEKMVVILASSENVFKVNGKRQLDHVLNCGSNLPQFDMCSSCLLAL